MDLENLLRDLPRVGRLVKDRGYRQVWRFEWSGRAYFLKFYPRGGFRDRWRRRFRGSPARREFERLTWLQKAKVAAPKAVAYLVGLTLQGRKGDAVILEAIEPAVPLDQYLNDHALRGEPIPNHLDLAKKVRDLILKLGQAKLGHDDLHLGNFLLSDGKLHLIDAYAVRPGGMRMNDLLQLGHSVLRYATRTDLLRGWDELGSGGTPPKTNRLSAARWTAFVRKAAGGNHYFGRIDLCEWSGVCFNLTKYPRRWSSASQLRFTKLDWEAAWPEIWRKIEGDAFEVVKRSASGDVLAGVCDVGGRSLDVIVKRPRKKHLYRYLADALRGSRARRAWFKSYAMIARNIPVAWPLLLMERKAAGYVTDAVLVFERVPGETLSTAELDSTEPSQRDTLFRRIGRTLRQIERLGFQHYDAKSANWIIRPDEKLGPLPVMVDVDGIRRMPSAGFGLHRLLRSMKSHPQYTPADSLALCQGYAPYARLHQEAALEPTDI